MKLSKVKLKHETTGVIIKVNEADWAQDLGRAKYPGYSRVGEIHSGRKEDVLHVAPEPEPEPDVIPEPEPVEEIALDEPEEGTSFFD